MIESACRSQRMLHGAAAYHDCLNQQVAALKAGPARPSLADASSDERGMIESACRNQRLFHGPAAYYDCLNRQVTALKAIKHRPSLAAASRDEAVMIEYACQNQRLFRGPAAYYDCLNQQLSALEAIPVKPSLAAVSAADRGRIESACHNQRHFHGPAAYYSCIDQQLAARSRRQLATPAPGNKEKGSQGLSSVEVARNGQARSGVQQRSSPSAGQIGTAEQPSRMSPEVSSQEPRRAPGKIPSEIVSSEGPAAAATPAPTASRPYGFGIFIVASVAGWLVWLAYRGSRGGKCKKCGNTFRGPARYCPSCTADIREEAKRADDHRPDSSREEAGERFHSPKREPESDFDPYMVLGIARNASQEEIRAAYYRQMASYHPDKVAHLGEDLQELAKRKTQAINRAYEELVNVV